MSWSWCGASGASLFSSLLLAASSLGPKRSLHSPVNLAPDLEGRSLNALRQVMSLGFLEKDDHVIIVLSSMVDNDCGAYIGVYDIKKLLYDLENKVTNDLFKGGAAAQHDQ